MGPERKTEERKLRYVFMDYAEKYLKSVSALYSEETLKTRERRYRRLDRICKELYEQKKISTTSPEKFKVEDILAIYSYKRSTGVAIEDVLQDIVALKKLCESLRNPCVGFFVTEYNIKAPRANRNRLPVMEDRKYDMILKKGLSYVKSDDFIKVRAYTMVLLFLDTGARNKELRLANVADLDTTDWRMFFANVKGGAQYGCQRSVPIRPVIHQLIYRYLELRAKWVAENNPSSIALFPASHNLYKGYLSSNGIRKVKEMVVKDVGFNFDLRQCRRTFGQRYINANADIQDVSIVMGHSSTKTTERYYCRKENEDAINGIMKTWSERDCHGVDS